MSKSHNKKRNVGLIYEFLCRNIAKSLIEENHKVASKTLNILTESFDKDSELYKEFCLFNSLIRTTVRSDAVANSIVTESRSLSRKIDLKKLRAEKSQVIKRINYEIGPHLYEQNVPDYKIFATIQTLMNSWRKPENYDLAQVANYEDMLVEHLTSDKSQSLLEDQLTEDADQLVVEIMTQKINKRFLGQLNETQTELVRKFSLDGEDTESLREHLEKMRQGILQKIDDYCKINTKEKMLIKKLNESKEKILNIDLEDIDQKTIARFMEIAKLEEEFLSPDDEGGTL